MTWSYCGVQRPGKRRRELTIYNGHSRVPKQVWLLVHISFFSNTVHISFDCLELGADRTGSLMTRLASALNVSQTSLNISQLLEQWEKTSK